MARTYHHVNRGGEARRSRRNRREGDVQRRSRKHRTKAFVGFVLAPEAGDVLRTGKTAEDRLPTNKRSRVIRAALSLEGLDRLAYLREMGFDAPSRDEIAKRPVRRFPTVRNPAVRRV